MQLVVIESDSENEAIPTPKAEPKPKQLKPAKIAKQDVKPAKITKQDVSKPAKIAKPDIKPAKMAKPDVKPAKGAVSEAPSQDAIPEFACAAWSTRFLPTLYDCLGCAADPFVMDPDMVKCIQEVVDLVHPEADYTVRLNDKIFVRVS
jgi:hypothetical protein